MALFYQPQSVFRIVQNQRLGGTGRKDRILVNEFGMQEDILVLRKLRMKRWETCKVETHKAGRMIQNHQLEIEGGFQICFVLDDNSWEL